MRDTKVNRTSEPKRKPVVQSSPLRSAFTEKDADKALQVKERYILIDRKYLLLLSFIFIFKLENVSLC